MEAASNFLSEDSEILGQMERVAALIKGFEDPYGMELLSSVHWIMREVQDARTNFDVALRKLHAWSPRKRRVLKPDHVLKAWQRLKDQGWDAAIP